MLVYLLCVLGIGIPIMMAETLLGRRGRQSPINTMASLADEAGASALWRYVGWLGVVAGFLILSYYSVIAGWSMAYLFKTAGGFLNHTTVEAAQQTFLDLKNAPDVQLVWHTLFIAGTLWIVSRGVSEGIERVTRYMMPGLLIMLVALDIYATGLDGFGQAFSFLFTPNLSRLTAESVLVGMGQAFFSLGLGMGSIMVYGSYLPDHVSISRSTVVVALADTLVAVMAGLAMFPIAFSHHLEPGMGPGLIFETLPLAFSQMQWGGLIGTLFFALVFIAAITSAIALIEPAVAWLTENQGMSRQKATTWAGAACWLLGVGTLLSFNAWSDVTWFGKTFFELVDFITADFMLPLGGVLVAVFAGWVLSADISAQELALGRHFALWRTLIRWVAPIAVTTIFLKATGLL